jgi:Bacterial SH3 domain
MNLLCRLGRHRPGGIPRWNDGFYFAACENCGCDLVRTAFQGWHVPKGYKVVWSERPPVPRPDVALVPSDLPTDSPGDREAAAPAANDADEPVPPASGDEVDAVAGPATSPGGPDRSPEPAASPGDAASRSKLPIQDVLAHLAAEEAAQRAAAPTPEEAPEPPPPPPLPPPPPPPPRRQTWDFMDDDPTREEPAPRRSRAEADPALPPAAGAPPVMAGGTTEEASPQPPTAGPAGPPRRSARSAVREFWSGPAEPNPRMAIALAAMVAVAIAVVTAFAGPWVHSPAGAPEPTRDAGPAPEAPGPFAASAPEEGASEPEAARPQEFTQAATAAGSDRAYVAASLLSCRAAPALQARRVRSLGRGDEVRILGMEDGWVSLASHGGQCWAQARYISPAPPL